MSATDAHPSHVRVAVPVPLRRTFVYRLPVAEWSDRVQPGSRVAVPFGRRKLPAIVLARNEPPPEAVRVKDVAGLLDAEPLFTPELLAFLDEAARYYMHPVGEVLRAAAPALPADAMRALRRQGFLDAGEALPGSRIGGRRTWKIHPLEAPQAEARLGVRQRAVLDEVRRRGGCLLEDLRGHAAQPRTVVRALEAKGLVRSETCDASPDPFFAEPVEPQAVPTPNQAQATAIARLVARLEKGGGFLLYGVTGSGKTEVYLRVIEEARQRGRGALMLVPEIALTPQLVSRFRARFGDAIAVLHSGLSDRERDVAWRALRQGRVSLAIGARSALFAPVADLGVVAVDEEHDPSFKQEEGFRYNARDMALLRAARAGAVCILGSATPSLESWHSSERGKLERLELPRRAAGQDLPDVEIVDLARNRRGPSGHRLLSAPLYRGLERCLEEGGQAILFLNRRGFAPSVRCLACGQIARCPACSVALTEHRSRGLLRCHYCDFAMPSTTSCRECGQGAYEALGIGTERMQQSLEEAFPSARVARLDRDTASGRGVEAVLQRLRRGDIDILVGTQMVTKGHDVPGVTLVGVVLADQSLAFPDFRAAERTFQLLSQVAGRAGRGERPGRVVLQAYEPEHPALRMAAAHDYRGFCDAEMRARRELGYPPFSRIVAVRVDAGDEARARETATMLAQLAKGHPAVRARAAQVLGPAPAPLARLRGRYRFRLMVRGKDLRGLRAVAAALVARIDEGVQPSRATIDVDPIAML